MTETPERNTSYSRVTTENGATTVETFQFDEAGNLVEQTSQADFFGRGRYDYKNVITNTYDDENRLVETVNSDDNNNDSVVDNRVSDKFTYDDRGNIVLSEHVSDYGADGYPEYRAVYEDTYNENNQLVKTISRYENQGDAALFRMDTEWFTYSDAGYLERIKYDFFSDSTIDKVVEYIDTLMV